MNIEFKSSVDDGEPDEVPKQPSNGILPARDEIESQMEDLLTV